MELYVCVCHILFSLCAPLVVQGWHLGLPKRRSAEIQHLGLPKFRDAEGRHFGSPISATNEFLLLPVYKSQQVSV